MDRLFVEIYENNTYKGYLQSLSIYHNKIAITKKKDYAKGYDDIEDAKRDIELVYALSKFSMIGNIV